MHFRSKMFSFSSVVFVVATLCLFQASTLDAALIPSLLQRPVLKAQLRKACQERNEPKILEISEHLSKVNPTTDIIRNFGRLDGRWKLEYTTAPESEVPSETNGAASSSSDDSSSSFGGKGIESAVVKTYQEIDTSEGIIYNVIDRGLPQKGLRISVGAEPTHSGRVALDFRTIEAYNDKFPKKVTLQFPPRAFFRTLSKAGSIFKGKPFDELEFKEIAHFDVLYLDDNLRIQRNSEGNLFVNSKLS